MREGLNATKKEEEYTERERRHFCLVFVATIGKRKIPAQTIGDSFRRLVASRSALYDRSQRGKQSEKDERGCGGGAAAESKQLKTGLDYAETDKEGEGSSVQSNSAKKKRHFEQAGHVVAADEHLCTFPVPSAQTTATRQRLHLTQSPHVPSLFLSGAARKKRKK